MQLFVKWDDGRIWANDGVTIEVPGISGETENGLVCSHEGLNADSCMVGQKIRLYWAEERRWYYGEITAFNENTHLHAIKYDDGEEEELDLLVVNDDIPAWEVAPFTGGNGHAGERFAF